MTDHELFNMKLHECKWSNFGWVMRVPGGWIYQAHSGGNTFVPFNQEFKPPIVFQETPEKYVVIGETYFRSLPSAGLEYIPVNSEKQLAVYHQNRFGDKEFQVIPTKQ